MARAVAPYSGMSAQDAPNTAPPPEPRQSDWEPYLLSAALLTLTTMLGTALGRILPPEAMGLIFTGLIAAMASHAGRAVGLFTALVAFLLWNFYFLPPLHTFSVANPQDVVALVVFWLVGLLTGQLAGRVRQEAAAAAARVEALRRISVFAQRLSRAATLTDVLSVAAEEAAALAGQGAIWLATPGGLQLEACRPAAPAPDDAAREAARACLESGAETGLGTARLAGHAWRCLPLAGNAGRLGVLGVRPATAPLAPQAQALGALAGQTALAVERARLSLQAARAQAQEDNQQLRNALLSSLSHDLRTPLTSIRGAAETLTQAGDALDEATRADLLASITQDSARMARFLSNLMDVARAEAGGLKVRQERVRLEEVIEAAIGRVNGTLPTRLDLAAAHVRADPGLLEQVLVNLLENAVKYAPPASLIRISASRRADKICLEVADEGVGIAPHELASVFDSFFRASRGDRVAPGTGLGLAIAKAFTEAMGGRISAQSPRADLPADGLPGTIIAVELPAA